MLKSLQGYLFETIVIFIGITFSFLFEQWRQQNADKTEIKNYLNLILLDIDDLLLSDNTIGRHNDSIETVLFKKVENKSIEKTELTKLFNQSDEYIEYSSTSFSIIHISQSSIFEKLVDQQRIVSYVHLINETISRENQLRTESDKVIQDLFTYLSTTIKINFIKAHPMIELEITDDDLKKHLSNPEFQNIMSKLRAIKMQHRLLRKKIIELSIDLRSFIKEYNK